MAKEDIQFVHLFYHSKEQDVLIITHVFSGVFRFNCFERGIGWVEVTQYKAKIMNQLSI